MSITCDSHAQIRRIPRLRGFGRHGVEQLLWRNAHQEMPERLLTCLEPRLIRPEDLAS